MHRGTHGDGSRPLISASAYKINEDLYSYTKDSDTWSCVQGNETYKKKATSRMKQGKEWHGYKYYFNREQCRKCPRREECIGKATAVGKILNIGENAPEYYEYSQREKIDEFKEKYKNRAIIEPKNAEMKRFHGLARAGGYGLVSVEKQVKLTVIAVNLKRICKIVSSKNPKKSATDPISAADLKLFIVICQIQGRKTATFSVVSDGSVVFPLCSKK